MILGDPRKPLGDRECIELGERQAKRSGDSEVSLELLGSR
jgi:hypothetical protein